MSGEYNFGDVHFENHCAGFVPKDWENPDFKANFDALITIFEREGLLPITKDDWESTFGEHSKKAKTQAGRILKDKAVSQRRKRAVTKSKSVC